MYPISKQSWYNLTNQYAELTHHMLIIFRIICIKSYVLLIEIQVRSVKYAKLRKHTPETRSQGH